MTLHSNTDYLDRRIRVAVKCYKFKDCSVAENSRSNCSDSSDSAAVCSCMT